MTTSIQPATSDEVTRLISDPIYATISDDEKEIFRYCFATTTSMWIGFADDRLVCVWGLAPPTFLSDQAYLWLYTTEFLKGNEFRFVRHSQRMVQQMLDLYPVIVGQTDPANRRTTQWLKWLGAELIEPNPALHHNQVPFVIRKK